MKTDRKFRLVTRSDFDGLVCAVLLKELDIIDEILFVHPKDMQDGSVEITDRDITTNLPYVAGAHLVFDHHQSETLRNAGHRDNHIIRPQAPSAARVVFDHFGGATRFPKVSEAMMTAVDQADSAAYSLTDVLQPQGWTLLNYLMDARTGLGRFRDFRISNYQLMMKLIDACRTMDIDAILAMPDVVERIELYKEHQTRAAEQIRRCARVHGRTVVLDLRDEAVIYATNRFLIYALYPDCNLSIHVMWGLRRQNTVFAIGRSILDRSSPVNIGELCLRYGGGGHAAAGTCQIENSRAARMLVEVIERIDARQTEAEAAIKAAEMAEAATAFAAGKARQMPLAS